MSTDPPFNHDFGSPPNRPSLSHFPPIVPVHRPLAIFQPFTSRPLRPSPHPSVEDFVRLVAARYSRSYPPMFTPTYASPSSFINPSSAPHLLSSIGYANLLNLLEQTSQTSTPTYLNPLGHAQLPRPLITIPAAYSNPLSFGSTSISQPLREPTYSNPQPVVHAPTPQHSPLPVDRSELDLKQLHPESYVDQLAAAIGAKNLESFRRALENNSMDDHEFLAKCIYHQHKKRLADRDNATVFTQGKISYQIMMKDKPMTAKQWSEFKEKAEGLISVKDGSKYYYCKCIECLMTKAEFVSLQYNTVFSHIMRRECIYVKCSGCGSTFKTEKSASKHKCRKKLSVN